VTRCTAVLLALLAGAAAPDRPIALVIHGGAGVISRQTLTSELEAQYRDGLERALRAGHAVLAKGGASLDAVEAAILLLEDDPLFNAGRGAVFTHEGRNEMDAALMEGRTRRAGSVAGLSVIRHPISAARAVMERSPHVLLVGRGADLFASEQGLEVVDPAWFWTERRWKQLQDKLRETAPGAPVHDGTGTVGAVALDRHGDLAAGTSTGGTTNKRAGRVGDSPIIGAGTFADNSSCAVSATGHGEFFIRFTVASELCALVRHKGLSVKQAGDQVVHGTLKAAGGEGGLIVLDAGGNFATPFNSEGMYRGWIGEDGVPQVRIFKD
jgi:beta-aspartyl-peptidase (threonine type)